MNIKLKNREILEFFEMTCLRKNEILKILENKIYPDLGKIIISYLIFIPPTPEELFILAVKFYSPKYNMMRYQNILANSMISKKLKIYTKENRIIFNFSYNIPRDVYNLVLKIEEFKCFLVKQQIEIFDIL